MENSRSEKIAVSMQEIFRQYNKLRDGKTRNSIHETESGTSDVEKHPFWDIVVLTTFDETQKQCFEHQINRKKELGHLPEVPIFVISDPVGQKLGVGGSTLHVLTELLKNYSDELYTKRILIIHSGGSSQRLPSYSVIGKIFTPVACKGLQCDSSVPQMLDIKFAMYLPFCQLLEPGVFVTCADDIETYCLDLDALDLEALKTADVVALAHPSDVKTGEGHGVYVFEGREVETASFVNAVLDCSEVLQKPSESAMREKGAVFMRDNNDTLKEQVWSDSVFWFSGRVCKKLVTWYACNSPLTIELDAYAHFLPCLGTRMKTAKPSDYKDFRSEMLPVLKDCSLKVVLLNDSKFYHLGTMEEYLSHLTVMTEFSRELGLLKNISNNKMPFQYESSSDESDTFPPEVAVIETHFVNPLVKIILTSGKTRILIENCLIDVGFKTKGNLILNNCTIRKCTSVVHLSDNIELFDTILYHTIPINFQKQLLYVTVAFDLTADMKKSSTNLGDIFIYGCPLSDAIEVLGYNKEEIRDNSTKSVSLWTAKLFVGSHTAEESFWLTHNSINMIKKHTSDCDVQTDTSGCLKVSKFSMVDLVKYKDLDVFIKNQDNLHDLNRG